VADRRRQLLENALELFAERGVAGASMRELARRAGVNVAAAYHHFDSKRDLLRAVFEELGSAEEISARIEPEILEVLRSVPAPDALALIVQLCWNRMEANAAYYRLLHAEVLRGDPDALAVSLEMWDGWASQLEDFTIGACLAEPPEAVAFARLLQSILWGLFNETRPAGTCDEDYRKQRSREIARLLAASLPPQERRQAEQPNVTTGPKSRTPSSR
jgi:AcrR family transcriptional regulator